MHICVVANGKDDDVKALNWLDNPSSVKGIYFASGQGADDWEFASYDELACCASQVASLLVDHGLLPGDIVSILPSNPRDFVAAFYGTIIAGGTPSPVATPLTFRSLDVYLDYLEQIFRSATPSLILVGVDLFDIVHKAAGKSVPTTTVIRFSRDSYADRESLARRDLAEHVLLQFTSGSSGTPKGVQVTSGNLDANLASNIDWIDASADHVAVSWLPFYHDMGLIGMLLTPVTVGADVRLLTPGQFLRSPLRWLECLSRDEGIMCTAAPSFGYAYAARRLQPEDIEYLDFSRWKTAIIAAERMDPVGVEKFLELTRPCGFTVDRFAAAYGLAESVLTVTGTRPDTAVPLVQLEKSALPDGEPVVVTQRSTLGDPGRRGGTWVAGCGTPLCKTDVDIIDENGAVLPEGYHGQVRVRGNTITDGYRTTSPHSSTSFSEDGLCTGDTGFLLGGELFVIGRTGDSIKIRGVKLFAEDLDTRISEATGLNPGRYTVLLGTAIDVDVVTVIIESDELGWNDCWLDSVRSVVISVISDTVGYAVFRGERGVIERTSSGKPRRRVLWQRLLDGGLPVALVSTNWEAISDEPAPWGGAFTDNAAI
ncbi:MULTISPECIES: AMP-binding protein [unclassified Mycobacteroides]|uniref:AMP-binding protein n=1 Tax=unclassified Mycobacteroides TaxID=2618759 RepID=UPI001EF078C1|nr:MULTISPECIES: AMP-binding protein [unclassified Mycobacteroides]